MTCGPEGRRRNDGRTWNRLTPASTRLLLSLGPGTWLALLRAQGGCRPRLVRGGRVSGHQQKTPQGCRRVPWKVMDVQGPGASVTASVHLGVPLLACLVACGLRLEVPRLLISGAVCHLPTGKEDHLSRVCSRRLTYPEARATRPGTNCLRHKTGPCPPGFLAINRPR